MARSRNRGTSRSGPPGHTWPAWKADYPGKPYGENRVFLTNNTHGPLQYAGVVKQIRKIAARAGVEKHITPHLFRHSRSTHLLRKGVPEPVIKRMMWGP